MNSFVQRGVHPLHHADGFSVELAIQIMRNSNGISHIACWLMARLAQHLDAAFLIGMERSYMDFEDCVPMAPAN